MIRPLKSLVKSLLGVLGCEPYRVATVPSLREQNPDVTDREWEIYSKVSPFTMLSMERVLANIRAVDHVIMNGIPGDVVECGVWRGGSGMALALAMKDQDSRHLWMYDTYAGMTEPMDVDVSYAGASAAELLALERPETSERNLVRAYASLADVQANIEATGYPMDQVKFVRGPVEQTIPADVPERIALLRMDTDWYESTRHELIHLYPLLSPGGILIIDDYGHWRGARKAVDEFFDHVPIYLNRIDYTGRLAVKPPPVGYNGLR